MTSSNSVSVSDLRNDPGVQIIDIASPEHRSYAPFPLSKWPHLQPHEVDFAATYILRLPYAQVYSSEGVIFYQGKVIADLIWPNDFARMQELLTLSPHQLREPTNVTATVAVITQGGQNCYYHWLSEVLPRLALLQQHGIKYDYLVVPLDAPYKLQTLTLWGIDTSKIIDPTLTSSRLSPGNIHASEVIVPSLIDRTIPDRAPQLASYMSSWAVEAVRNHLLPKVLEQAQLKSFDPSRFAKKIFISRQDATARRISNEDVLFEKLQALGYKRYHLSQMSFVDQAYLFANAEEVVAIHGAGMSNLIFSQPSTKVFELFQARSDATYWFLSQILGLRYQGFKTQEFDENEQAGAVDTTIGDEVIARIIEAISLAA